MAASVLNLERSPKRHQLVCVEYEANPKKIVIPFCARPSFLGVLPLPGMLSRFGGAILRVAHALEIFVVVLDGRYQGMRTRNDECRYVRRVFGKR
jgi:hypothetical protein